MKPASALLLGIVLGMSFTSLVFCAFYNRIFQSVSETLKEHGTLFNQKVLKDLQWYEQMSKALNLHNWFKNGYQIYCEKEYDNDELISKNWKVVFIDKNKEKNEIGTYNSKKSALDKVRERAEDESIVVFNLDNTIDLNNSVRLK